jgi:opacity protein-like surface antigen
MFKKGYLWGVSAFVCLSSAQAGFYLSPQIGTGISTGNYSALNNQGGALYGSRNTNAAFLGGIGVGYAWVSDKLYVAFEVAGLFNSLNNRAKPFVDDTGVTLPDARLKNRFAYYTEVRLGSTISNGMVPFVSLGLSGGKYMMTLQNSSDTAIGGLAARSTERFSKQIMGLTPGLGLIMPFTKNMACTLRYAVLLFNGAYYV